MGDATNFVIVLAGELLLHAEDLLVMGTYGLFVHIDFYFEYIYISRCVRVDYFSIHCILILYACVFVQVSTRQILYRGTVWLLSSARNYCLVCYEDCDLSLVHVVMC